MFARALLILLLVLNVGVATWWATRTSPSPPTAAEPPPGVARLQLVGEPSGAVAAMAPMAPMATPAAAAVQPNAVASPAAAVAVDSHAPQCFSFGPFTDGQAVIAAQARLQPLTQRIVVRERRDSGRGWRVLLPALPSAEQAEATAQRIAAAGFSDYLVVREGAEVNSIALGRYGNETAARRHAAAVVAAGFAARAEALGVTQTWLDVSAAPGFDAPAAQRLAAAPERHSLDCATLPTSPAASAR